MSEASKPTKKRRGTMWIWLTCGHDGVWDWPIEMDEGFDRLPRRKDGNFGAVKCFTCSQRRQIVSARWSTP